MLDGKYIADTKLSKLNYIKFIPGFNVHRLIEALVQYNIKIIWYKLCYNGISSSIYIIMV